MQCIIAHDVHFLHCNNLITHWPSSDLTSCHVVHNLHHPLAFLCCRGRGGRKFFASEAAPSKSYMNQLHAGGDIRPARDTAKPKLQFSAVAAVKAEGTEVAVAASSTTAEVAAGSTEVATTTASNKSAAQLLRQRILGKRPSAEREEGVNAAERADGEDTSNVPDGDATQGLPEGDNLANKQDPGNKRPEDVVGSPPKRVKVDPGLDIQDNSANGVADEAVAAASQDEMAVADDREAVSPACSFDTLPDDAVSLRA